MTASNGVRRVVVAVVAIPLALAIVWQGGWLLAFVLSVVCVLGVRELYAFAVRQGIRPLVRTGLATAFVLPPAVYYALTREPALRSDGPYWAAAWLLAVLLMALARRRASDRPLSATAVTVFGVLYAAVLPCFLLAIRHTTYAERDWSGTWLVFVPLVVTWVGDTAAMVGGKLLGGPKLAPAVSPGKTWSGALCGTVASVATIPLLNVLVLTGQGVPFPLLRAIVFGLVLSVLGQAGDLVESLFKREVSLKDSSALISGHGGMLDRFDSLYFAIPAAAALYRLFEVL